MSRYYVPTVKTCGCHWEVEMDDLYAPPLRVFCPVHAKEAESFWERLAAPPQSKARLREAYLRSLLNAET